MKHKKHEVLTPEVFKKIAAGSGVRVKPVRCGKPSCKKCPHFIYVYKRIYSGGKTKEIYLGKLKR